MRRLESRLAALEASIGVGQRMMYVVEVPQEDPRTGAALSDNERSALVNRALAAAGVTTTAGDTVVLLTRYSGGEAQLVNSCPFAS
jgi:hypothetical protein